MEKLLTIPKKLITSLDKKKSSQLEILDFLDSMSTSKEYKDLAKEVVIRFDTEPRRYEKLDFQKLILLILEGWGNVKTFVESHVLSIFTPITDELINSLFEEVES